MRSFEGLRGQHLQQAPHFVPMLMLVYFLVKGALHWRPCKSKMSRTAIRRQGTLMQ